jgi:hypothetical protein
MKTFHMPSFEMSAMSWSAIITFVLLLASTLIAQFGFVVYAQEHADLEQAQAAHDRYWQQQRLFDDQSADLNNSISE